MSASNIEIQLTSTVPNPLENASRAWVVMMQIATRVAELKAKTERLSMSDLDLMLRVAFEDQDFVELAALSAFLAEISEE